MIKVFAAVKEVIVVSLSIPSCPLRIAVSPILKMVSFSVITSYDKSTLSTNVTLVTL